MSWSCFISRPFVNAEPDIGIAIMSVCLSVGSVSAVKRLKLWWIANCGRLAGVFLSVENFKNRSVIIAVDKPIECRHNDSRRHKRVSNSLTEFARCLFISILLNSVTRNMDPCMAKGDMAHVQNKSCRYLLSYSLGSSMRREVGPRKWSAMVPFERAMVVSYRLSIVTTDLSLTTGGGSLYGRAKFGKEEINWCEPNFNAIWERQWAVVCKRNCVDIFCRLSAMYERVRQTDHGMVTSIPIGEIAFQRCRLTIFHRVSYGARWLFSEGPTHNISSSSEGSVTDILHKQCIFKVSGQQVYRLIQTSDRRWA